MTAQRLFPRSSFVGFDRLFDELERVSLKTSEQTYPPHNIVKVDDTTYQVELAVAGFRRDDLSIEVNDRTLIVTGEHFADGREYVHKGISAKKFRRVFTLSEFIEIGGAEYLDGVLTIQLNVVIPEEKKARKIDIGYTKPEAQLLTE